MADDADRAQPHEAAFLAQALERVREASATPGLGYLTGPDGKSYCRGCDALVPQARVNAAPHSGLCVVCQAEAEGER